MIDKNYIYYKKLSFNVLPISRKRKCQIFEINETPSEPSRFVSLSRLSSSPRSINSIFSINKKELLDAVKLKNINRMKWVFVNLSSNFLADIKRFCLNNFQANRTIRDLDKVEV